MIARLLKLLNLFIVNLFVVIFLVWFFLFLIELISVREFLILPNELFKNMNLVNFNYFSKHFRGF